MGTGSVAGLRALLTALLAVWAPIALLAVLFVTVKQHSLAADFVHEHRFAARAVIDGRSPYPTDLQRALRTGFGFVYPPLTAFLALPVALLPSGISAWVATLLTIAMIPTLLWALRVSDWRCYAVVFLWFPALSAIETANLSLPLACGLALCWRWRRRPVIGGALAGGLVAAKVLLWPVLIWAASVRRYRLAAWGLASAAVAIVVPWAVISFRGAGAYPHLLRELSGYEGPRSRSVAALFMWLTGNWALAEATGLLVGFITLAIALRLGRAGRERPSFMVAATAALFLTPVVWAHYLVLLAVVVGVAQRRFGVAWMLPLGLWLWPFLPTSSFGPHGEGVGGWQTVLALATVLATLGTALRAGDIRLRQEPSPATEGLPQRLGERVLRPDLIR